MLCTLYSVAVPIVEPVAEQTISKLSQMYWRVSDSESKHVEWLSTSYFVHFLTSSQETLLRWISPYWNRFHAYQRPFYLKFRSALRKSQTKRFDGEYMISFWKSHSIPRFHTTFGFVPIKHELERSTKVAKYEKNQIVNVGLLTIMMDNFLIGIAYFSILITRDSYHKVLYFQEHSTSVFSPLYRVRFTRILLIGRMRNNSSLKFKLFLVWCLKFFSLVFFSAHYMYLVMLYRNLKAYDRYDEAVRNIQLTVVAILLSGFVMCHVPILYSAWKWLTTVYSRYIEQRAEHSIQFLSMGDLTSKA
jgi:hypothetical protein